MEKQKHCHFQIQYDTIQGNVESLAGFNPTNKEDRQLLHDSLDEFLDNYLIGQYNRNYSGSKGCWFKVFGTLDE